MKTRICTNCHIEKDLNNFAIIPKGKFGRAASCKSCRKNYRNQRYAKDPIFELQKQRARINKITVQEYREILKIQNNQCDLCKQSLQDKHGFLNSNIVKKLVCLLCKNRINYFLDEIEDIKVLLDYMESNHIKRNIKARHARPI